MDTSPAFSTFDAVGSRTILLLEATPNLGNPLRRVLATQGWRVLGERSGAVELPLDPDIAAVVFDLPRPEPNSVELARQWRRSQGDALPPLLLACSELNEDLLWILDSVYPFDALLLKPTPPARLLRVLRNLIDAAAQRRAPTPSLAWTPSKKAPQ